MKKTRLQLEYELCQLQHRLEQNTKLLQRMMTGGILGGFAITVVLGFWIYLMF